MVRTCSRKPWIASAVSSVGNAPLDCSQMAATISSRSEEHTSELQSRQYLVCRLLLEKKKKKLNKQHRVFVYVKRPGDVYAVSASLRDDESPVTVFECVLLVACLSYYFFFFFNNTAPPEIYPLPLHDALPILTQSSPSRRPFPPSRPKFRHRYQGRRYQFQFPSLRLCSGWKNALPADSPFPRGERSASIANRRMPGRRRGKRSKARRRNASQGRTQHRPRRLRWRRNSCRPSFETQCPRENRGWRTTSICWRSSS